MKDRLNIVDVVGGYVRLAKTGINHKGLCPFHSEKTPSFMVNEERQIYHCFGCDEGGDVISFIQQIEAMSFPEALRLLADRAGVELPTYDRSQSKDTVKKDEKVELYEGLALAANRFAEHLQGSAEGKKAHEYLLGRGLTEETLQSYKLGYSLDVWHDTDDALQQAGYSRESLLKSGLLVANAEGRMYDRFRGRVMFPIQDVQGQVIGFGGRVLHETDDSGAKYINTPQTPVYNKSKVLYGIHAARLAIRKQDYVVLVEGYTDVLMSHQAGVRNVVSVSGTALTEDHLKILSRYTKNIMFAFDSDAAGERASKRSVIMALQEGWNVKVVQLEGGLDPADAIVKDPDVWTKALRNAMPVVDYYFLTAMQKHSASEALGKKQIAAEVLGLLRYVESPIERSHYLQKLSSSLGVPEDTLHDVLRGMAPRSGSAGRSWQQGQQGQGGRLQYGGSRATGSVAAAGQRRHGGDRVAELQELCLALVFGMHQRIELTELRLELFDRPEWKPLVDAIEAVEGAYDFDAILAGQSRELQISLKRAIVKAEQLLDQSDATPSEEFARCYSELVRLSLQKSIQQTQQVLRQAEEQRDEATVARSTQQLQDLLEELRSVS